jgi:hypothetical protein
MGRLATLLGRLLLSRTGRGLAGRHTGKLALATLAFQLWQQRRQGRGAAFAPGDTASLERA